MNKMEELALRCSGCGECKLCQGRTNSVFGVGDPNSPVMLIGEGPGEQEDLQGEPFVGPAGKLLDMMLEMIDLDRTRVYIANIVKCRPPHNRDPQDDEKEACRHWLDEQISIVKPKIIVCLGRISATSLIDSEFRITRQHGEWFNFGSCRICATFHPSALLRDESKRPDAFCDLRSIRAMIRELCPEIYTEIK